MVNRFNSLPRFVLLNHAERLVESPFAFFLRAELRHGYRVLGMSCLVELRFEDCVVRKFIIFMLVLIFLIRNIFLGIAIVFSFSVQIVI